MNAETRERFESALSDLESLSRDKGISDERAAGYYDAAKLVQKALDASPEPARAEPVAWLIRQDSEAQWFLWQLYKSKPDLPSPWEIKPLYAAPPPPTLPPGWVAVPVEPTEAMYQQGREVARNYLPKHGMLEATFRAMLAAAPPCPAVSLPEGWPWDAETRGRLSEGFDQWAHDIGEAMDQGPEGHHGQMTALIDLARWLDQSPPTEDNK
jgi:hypothetical protein